MQKIIFILVLFVYWLTSFAADLSGEGNYRRNKVNEHVNIFYTSEDVEAAENINYSVPKIINYYSQSFDYQMDQTLNVILASAKHHQVLNGYSTQIPFNMTMYYGGGAADPDYFAARSWVDLLSSHEIAHDFQLNSKNNWISKYGHKVFGNNALVMPIIPLVTLPNIFLPNFLLEGNAVLNESIFNNGGRLFSGAQRAIAFTFMQAGKFTTTNMFNNQDDITFPFGNKPYIIAAYLQAYLATTYGIKTTNSFFQHNSTKPFMVLALDDSFQKTFGKGYDAIFADFLHAYQPLFSKTKLLQGKLVDKFLFSGRMSKQQNQIRIFTRHYAGAQSLVTFNCPNKQLHSINARQFPNGKPIVWNHQLYSASSIRTAYNQTTFGLVDRDFKLNPATVGKVVQDVQHGRMLYLDGLHSYVQPRLYLDDQFISISNSTAIFDKLNNIYYFKNSGKKRVLYKNRTPLYAYMGYWGFPIEVVGKRVYFIAGTKYGSTIFSVKDGEVRRESSADNILDARMINSTEFMAKVVTADSYELRIASTEIIKQAPYHYKYFFEHSAPIKLLQHKKIHTSSEYNSLLGLQFSSISLSGYYAASSEEEKSRGIKDSYQITTAINFSDALLQNSLSVGYTQTEDLKLASLKYENSRYRLHYAISAMKVVENLEPPINRYLDSPSGYGGSFELELPLVVYGRYYSSISLLGYMDYDDAHKNPLVASALWSYKEGSGASPFALWSWAILGYLKFDQQSYFTTVGQGDLSIVGGVAQVTKSFANELELGLTVQYSKANQGNTITLDDSYSVYGDPSDFHLRSLEFFHFAQEIVSSTVRFSKLFHWNSYHSWFPLSLRRESFYLEAEGVKLNYADSSRVVSVTSTLNYLRESELIEIRAGFNFDILVAHRSPVLFNLSYIYNSNSRGVNSIYFGTSSSF